MWFGRIMKVCFVSSGHKISGRGGLVIFLEIIYDVCNRKLEVHRELEKTEERKQADWINNLITDIVMNISIASSLY